MNNLKPILAVAFLFIILWVGCNACNDDKETKNLPTAAVPEATQTEINEIAKEHTRANKNELISSVNVFKERMNDYFISANLHFKIKKIPISDGKVYNTFQIMLNDNIGIIGALNKSNNSVREITMMGRGDGSVTSGADLILMIGGIISAADPSISATERGDIIREVGLLDEDIDINNLDASTTKNGIKYWIQSSEVIGISFGATPIGQK